MVVAAGLDLDLGLDALEERRLGMEDEPVRAGLDVGEVADRPSSSVSRSATSSSPRKSWTRTPRGGDAAARVEDVRRDHARILSLAAVGQPAEERQAEPEHDEGAAEGRRDDRRPGLAVEKSVIT